VTFETGKSPEPYRSTLENCRKLSAINRLLKCSYLDNWVANHRTPEHLNKYLEYFDPSFIGLVDEREKIDHVAKLYHAEYSKLANEKVTTEFKKLSVDDEQQEEKGYLYSHSAKIFIIDTQSRVRGFFYVGTPVNDMKEQVTSLF